MTETVDTNITRDKYKQMLEVIEMKSLQYRVEMDEIGYCVTNAQGTVAVFNDIKDAVEAMRSFENKRLPETWSKIPPAMQKALIQYGELSA